MKLYLKSSPLPPTALIPSIFASAALTLVAFLPHARGAADPDKTISESATEEPVVLNPFEVDASAADKGYEAGNSVSATRVSTAIADLPFAVSAFTPQFIADIGATDLYDVVKYGAGVSNAGLAFNKGSDAFAIRGFSQAPEHDGIFESSQGNVYVDMVGVDRVEIVKGPASLLYGQVAPGGTVNYITKRPLPNAFVSVGGFVSSYDYNRFTLDLNQPVIGKTLLFRVNAAYENGYEYAEPSKTKTWVAVPSLSWQITPKLQLKTSAQIFDRRENPPAQFIPRTEVSTPASMVAALNGASGYPAPVAALVGKTGADAAAAPNVSHRWQLTTIPLPWC